MTCCEYYEYAEGRVRSSIWTWGPGRAYRVGVMFGEPIE